jgi:hypothetical protein
MPARLNNAWVKAQRRFRRGFGALTAAAALAFGTAAGAAAQPAPAHAPVHAMTGVALAQKSAAKADYAFSEARLSGIKDKLRRTEIGRDMLAFAEEYKITIAMSNSKVMDDAPGDGFKIKGTYGQGEILLNGEEKRDDELVLTLVHELRHAWHDLALHQGDLRLDPLRRLTRDRILEADVFAFEAHFGYEYEKATGARLRLGNRMKPCESSASSLCILDGYAVNRDSGMAVSTAYGKLLERTMKVVHAKDYDKDFLDSQNEAWQGVIDDPAKGLDVFGEGASGLTPDADFMALMRRATTPGMKAGEGISGLASWTEKDFSSLRKTGGGETAVLLRKSTDKFNRARAAWNAFQKQDSQMRPAPASPSGRVKPGV